MPSPPLWVLGRFYQGSIRHCPMSNINYQLIRSPTSFHWAHNLLTTWPSAVPPIAIAAWSFDLRIVFWPTPDRMPDPLLEYWPCSKTEMPSTDRSFHLPIPRGHSPHRFAPGDPNRDCTIQPNRLPSSKSVSKIGRAHV